MRCEKGKEEKPRKGNWTSIPLRNHSKGILNLSLQKRALSHQFPSPMVEGGP